VPIFNDLNDTAVTDFFTSPWTFAHGIQDGKGTLRPVRQADGSIMCYLSLIEALIEAARLRLFGLTCQTLPIAGGSSMPTKRATSHGFTSVGTPMTARY